MEIIQEYVRFLPSSQQEEFMERYKQMNDREKSSVKRGIMLSMGMNLEEEQQGLNFMEKGGITDESQYDEDLFYNSGIPPENLININPEYVKTNPIQGVPISFRENEPQPDAKVYYDETQGAYVQEGTNKPIIGKIPQYAVNARKQSLAKSAIVAQEQSRTVNRAVPQTYVPKGSLNIKAERQKLKDLGWYKGEIDGISGPLTREAREMADYAQKKDSSYFENNENLDTNRNYYNQDPTKFVGNSANYTGEELYNTNETIEGNFWTKPLEKAGEFMNNYPVAGFLTGASNYDELARSINRSAYERENRGDVGFNADVAFQAAGATPIIGASAINIGKGFFGKEPGKALAKTNATDFYNEGLKLPTRAVKATTRTGEAARDVKKITEVINRTTKTLKKEVSNLIPSRNVIINLPKNTVNNGQLLLKSGEKALIEAGKVPKRLETIIPKGLLKEGKLPGQLRSKKAWELFIKDSIEDTSRRVIRLPAAKQQLRFLDSNVAAANLADSFL